MSDKIFADGLNIKSKETQYGEIIKLGIKIETFMDFLAKHENERGYVNIDIKKGKSGKWYSELNTYKSNSTTKSEEDDESIVDFDDMDEVPF